MATARRTPLTLSNPPDTRSEEQRMRAGLAHLRRLGYGVLEIGQAHDAAICHRCSRLAKRLVQIHCDAEGCGSLGYAPSSGNTKGTPDSFVFSDRWGEGVFLGMEWKDGPRGHRTPEQAELEKAGRIVVVWDTPSAVQAVRDFEATMKGAE